MIYPSFFNSLKILYSYYLLIIDRNLERRKTIYRHTTTIVAKWNLFVRKKEKKTFRKKKQMTCQWKMCKILRSLLADQTQLFQEWQELLPEMHNWFWKGTKTIYVLFILRNIRKTSKKLWNGRPANNILLSHIHRKLNQSENMYWHQ